MAQRFKPLFFIWSGISTSIALALVFGLGGSVANKGFWEYFFFGLTLGGSIGFYLYVFIFIRDKYAIHNFWQYFSKKGSFAYIIISAVSSILWTAVSLILITSFSEATFNIEGFLIRCAFSLIGGCGCAWATFEMIMREK